MSESDKYHITTELQKAKSEAGMRAKRIQVIVRDAFSQTIAEFKEGAGEIQATVKETLSKILEIVNETGESREETAQKTPSTSSKSMILAVFKAIRSRSFVNLHHRYAKFKNQTVNLDANLTERYGDRYVAVKQRLEKVAAWYIAVTAQAKTMEPNVLQHRQAEFENRLGEAGATLAKKERHVKQQLKEFLQTAAAKL